jgi:SAM-dependent methyltransferase
MSGAAGAYDAASKAYDQLLADAPRAPLHAAYRRHIRAGDRVLDAGCGTGIDSLFLATLGAHVVGVDISAGMLEIARARRYPPGVDVSFVHSDLQLLGSLDIAPVNAIVSGFAALNTVADLAAFAAGARARLLPDGRLILHVLTPGGLFDRLGDLSRGRLAGAVGGRRERTRSLRVGDTLVEHRLLRPDALFARYFAEAFVLDDVEQIGAFVPDEGPSRLPNAVFPALQSLDRQVARWPFIRQLGRFAILTLRPS